MADLSNPPRGGAALSAVLRGGPADFPESLRIQLVSPEQEKVKVPHRGGYEHFEKTGSGPAVDAEGPGLVFRWTMRSAIAE